MNKDRKKLRGKIDGSDGFMSGYGISKARTYLRKTPAWVLSNSETRKIISLAFPKVATDPRQRAMAGKWVQVIHLYYKLGYTRRQIAEDMGTTTRWVHDKLCVISRVSRGLTRRGKLRLGVKGPRRKEGTP